MSIRFACKCGKHLRAGDTMAGRHTLCPACGALVAIPSRDAPFPPAALPRRRPPDAAPPPGDDEGEEIGPVLVRVRRRNDRDPNQHRKSVWVPLDPDRGPPPEKLPRPVRRTRRRYEWKLETSWYQCLAYAFRARYLLLALALVQTALLVWAAVVAPRVAVGAETPVGADPRILALLAFLAAVYTVGFFDCVLTSAGAGEFRQIPIPGLDLGFVGAASWLLCFLAGPVLPAAVGLWYWHRCGDPDPLDALILVEVAGATFAYWFLEVLAAREAGGWFAGPVAVAKILDRLGPRSLVAATATPALAYVYVRMVSSGLTRWHTDGVWGVPVLLAAGLFGLFGATFLLRVQGVWSYHGRPASPKEAESAETGSGTGDAEAEGRPGAGSGIGAAPEVSYSPHRR